MKILTFFQSYNTNDRARQGVPTYQTTLDHVHTKQLKQIDIKFSKTNEGYQRTLNRMTISLGKRRFLYTH